MSRRKGPAIHPWLLTPGGLSRGQRARRLGEVGTFLLAAAFVALVASVLLSGCGVEKECGCGDGMEPSEMRIKTESVIAYNVIAGAAAGAAPQQFDFTTDPRLTYAVAVYFDPNPGTPQIINPAWASTGSLSWQLFPRGGPKGQTNYAAIRTNALPDAWEDDGTFASSFLVQLTASATLVMPLVTTTAGPLGRIIIEVRWAPAKGACFAPGEYDKILEEQALHAWQPSPATLRNGTP